MFGDLVEGLFAVQVLAANDKPEGVFFQGAHGKILQIGIHI